MLRRAFRKSSTKKSEPKELPVTAREQSSLNVSLASLGSASASSSVLSSASSSARAQGVSSPTNQKRQEGPSSSEWSSSASVSTVVDSGSSHRSGSGASQNRKQRRPSVRFGKVESSFSESSTETQRKRKVEAQGPAAIQLEGMYSLQQAEPSRFINQRFEILDTLGTGYSGKVKRAIDHRTGEVVALKVLDPFPENDPKRCQRTQRLHTEVKSMIRCGGHKHTVRLIDAFFEVPYPKRDGETVESNILVLELCERGELFELLFRGEPVPPAICHEYFRQLMSGIKHCHDLGVCHRDLKPENLLLDADFNLKIADFGFAAIGRMKELTSIVGSRSYMAPELAARMEGRYAYDINSYDGAKADVWSSGVILFTMLAGHPPMEKAVEKDWWFRAIQLGRLDYFWKSHERTAPTFPDWAKHLVNRMLRVDPDERISVDEIIEGFHAAPRASEYDLWLLQKVMGERYTRSRASKRVCILTGSSTRGTADSARAGTSGSPSPEAYATPSAAQAGVVVPQAHGESGRRMYNQPVPQPYERLVWRTMKSVGYSSSVPCMTEEDAAKITRGFMAFGTAKDVTDRIKHELKKMDAEIDGVNADGLEEFLETFEVTASIRKKGMWDVGLRARVFRVLPRDGSAAPPETADVPEKLVVVLWRVKGDYHRYQTVEAMLMSQMTREVKDDEEFEKLAQTYLGGKDCPATTSKGTETPHNVSPMP